MTVNPGAHYRFDRYTKPEIVLTTVAPAEAGWAAGTFPAVCSSFVWHCMQQNGVHFETTRAYVTPSDLAASAVAQGAQVSAGAMDGLFLYPQAERIAGGNVLDAIFMEDVLDQMGFFGNFLSGVAQNMVDQLLNTFAFDDAQNGFGSNAWQTLGDATRSAPTTSGGGRPPTHSSTSNLCQKVINSVRNIKRLGKCVSCSSLISSFVLFISILERII